MPSTSALTNYSANLTINALLRGVSFTAPVTVYVALFTSDPTDTGAAGAEVSGGSYARVAVTFGAPVTPGEVANSAVTTFARSTGAWGLVSHVAIMDALSSGNMLFKGAVEGGPLDVIAGVEVFFDIGDLVCQLT